MTIKIIILHSQEIWYRFKHIDVYQEHKQNHRKEKQLNKV